MGSQAGGAVLRPRGSALLLRERLGFVGFAERGACGISLWFIYVNFRSATLKEFTLLRTLFLNVLFFFGRFFGFLSFIFLNCRVRGEGGAEGEGERES